MKIVSSAARDAYNATVVMEAPTVDALMSPAAKQAAISEGGRLGLSRAGTAGDSSVYPVDAAGKTLTQLTPGQRAAAFRREFRLAGMP